MAGRCGCQGTCGCCVAPSATIAVGGSGSAGQCFQLSAKLDPAQANRMTAGPDGLSASLCATGPNGEQLGVNADGCLEIPPTVVRDYEGTPIAPGGDGSIQLPTGGLPPAYGCGLQTDGDGILSVAASGTWPIGSALGAAFTGPDTNGSPIYCGTDGKLRGAPQGTAIQAAFVAEVLATSLTPVPGTVNTPPSPAAVMVNPSPSRSMMITRIVGALVDVVVPSGGAVALRLQARDNGGSWLTVQEIAPAEPSAPGTSNRSRVPLFGSITSQLAPAGALTTELRVQAIRVGVGVDGPVLIQVSVDGHMIGVSQ